LTGAYGGSGAAIRVGETSVLVEDCILRDNVSLGTGAGLDGQASGLQVRRCLFQGNTSEGRGGGLSSVSGLLELDDCTFVNNTSATGGGGLSVVGGVASWIVGTTVVGNTAPEGSGIHISLGDIVAGIEVSACILADNHGSAALSWDGLGELELNNIDIWGNEDGDWVEEIAGFVGSQFNISANPMFCGAADIPPVFTLATSSPCLPDNNPGQLLMGAHGWGCDDPIGVPSAGLGASLSAHPNPFNPATVVSYRNVRSGLVHLALYDHRGRQLAILVNQHQEAGDHSVTWNGTDDSGRGLPSGVYLAVLTVGDQTQATKLTLVR